MAEFEGEEDDDEDDEEDEDEDDEHVDRSDEEEEATEPELLVVLIDLPQIWIDAAFGWYLAVGMKLVLPGNDA